MFPEKGEEQPLSGARVLEVGNYIAGPFCTKLLADFGAEVIKVEHPGRGDLARHAGPFPDDLPDPETSGLFLYLNAGKKSITLDLSTPSGARYFRELACRADAVVESLRPGVMARWGLDYPSLSTGRPGLSSSNPRLVMASVTDFGQTGPYRNYPASHLTQCALAGWAWYAGEPQRPPLQAGGHFTHYLVGAVAAMGMLAALYHQAETDEGQFLDIGGLEALVSVIAPAVTASAMGSDNPGRQGNAFPGTVECQDGYVGINALSYGHWVSVCRLLGLEELLDDPRFDSSFGRQRHGQKLVEQARPWLMARTKEQVFQEGQEHRIPTAYVNTPEDLVRSPHLDARHYFRQVEHPRLGHVKVPGPPFRLDASRPQPVASAPRLGEHTAAVLEAEFGLDRDDLRRLRAEGVI
ncbi:MAG: CoA transferase [Chloroflexi bacterium]|nr:CoA transferase [Chloroflexota bacterium]